MKYVLLYIIRGYQKFISPGLPSSCRFVPSCSQYGYEAIDEYGALKGGWMAIWRIARCNPFNAGGYDPVKPKQIQEQPPEGIDSSGS